MGDSKEHVATNEVGWKLLLTKLTSLIVLGKADCSQAMDRRGNKPKYRRWLVWGIARWNTIMQDYQRMT